MTHKFSQFLLAPLVLTAAAWLAPLPSAPLTPAPQAKTAPQAEITAALPVIPPGKFNFADYGAVGDGKTLNTAAFQKAVAAIEKAGGGHLIVPAGVYKTLPFTLTSHMDLHLDPGAIIKAPDTFEEYGIPDPNKATPTPPVRGRGAMGRPAALISCASGTTDLAITGSGVIDGSGAMFWLWSTKAALRYAPGRGTVPRPMLVVLPGVERLHVDGVTLTNSPSFHLAPSGQDLSLIHI